MASGASGDPELCVPSAHGALIYNGPSLYLGDLTYHRIQSDSRHQASSAPSLAPSRRSPIHRIHTQGTGTSELDFLDSSQEFVSAAIYCVRDNRNANTGSRRKLITLYGNHAGVMKWQSKGMMKPGVKRYRATLSTFSFFPANPQVVDFLLKYFYIHFYSTGKCRRYVGSNNLKASMSRAYGNWKQGRIIISWELVK
jgi:hypothetical protein